ncbi:DegT/DnrJ/EryC1/StrS family aminotransferase [Tuberibacillus sp. Marseille-P3662]|uniref:DegT/DnrJ/EryC1/StrS family aminotransferase n=1 Tax=Tuberibacillus sp. Marseille-P3662 TaxID=1965358 RepID=UPI000A1CA661|nr:DegT/DnrJ/EryC1/StrS family aminotransferase [Tuberibacillus sp. Marseille-P3662]
MSEKRMIPLASPVFNGNEKQYVLDCIDSTWISSGGKYVQAFERQFADYCGTQYAISCANGTVALHLALEALGIGPGDEVIVPTLTYIASANAVTYCGATPVFVDAEPETWNIDPDGIEAKINGRTKAIIAVHLYGHPVDMDAVQFIAAEHNLYVIEDAAEAHGAEYKNQRVGSIGDVACFSFFGNKMITTGEGGMITTNNDALQQKIVLLRGQGMDPENKYWFPVIGYNYRMTNMQAAIGLGQLENMEWHIQCRREVATAYQEQLSSLMHVIDLPVEQTWARHAYWMYTILLKPSVAISRDELIRRLKDDGIETRPVFYPMHILPPYKESAQYATADDIASRGLNLPSHARLTPGDIKAISESIAYHLND